MKRFIYILISAVVMVAALSPVPARAAEQDAIDGCIDRLREVGGPDARSGGEVLSSEYSEAATVVMLRDGGGTVWRCLGYSDGTVGELTVTNAADDGGGAMDGAAPGRLGGEATKPARQGCRQAVRQAGGAHGITIDSAEFSEAATLVMLRDGDGALWRCLASTDGTVSEVTRAGGGGSSSGSTAPAEPTTDTERVRFDAGTNGAELSRSLTPGSSTRFVLGARDGQNLYVRVAHRDGPRLDFQIFNPDGTFLLDMISTDKEYRGQLWQSGDHVIEVINRGGNTAEYNVIVGIE